MCTTRAVWPLESPANSRPSSACSGETRALAASTASGLACGLASTPPNSRTTATTPAPSAPLTSLPLLIPSVFARRDETVRRTESIPAANQMRFNGGSGQSRQGGGYEGSSILEPESARDRGLSGRGGGARTHRVPRSESGSVSGTRGRPPRRAGTEPAGRERAERHHGRVRIPIAVESGEERSGPEREHGAGWEQLHVRPWHSGRRQHARSALQLQHRQQRRRTHRREPARSLRRARLQWLAAVRGAEERKAPDLDGPG